VTPLPAWQQLADKHFIDRDTNVFDRIARMLGLPEYEPPQPPRFRLYDGVNLPITCRICGCNGWVDEGGTWACDHSRDEDYELIPMAVRDEKPMSEVSHFEPE